MKRSICDSKIITMYFTDVTLIKQNELYGEHYTVPVLANYDMFIRCQQIMMYIVQCIHL